MTKREELNLQNGISESQDSLNLSSQLLEREDIPNTPFQVIGNKDDGYFIALGRYRLTDPVESKSEAINKLITEQWYIMLRIQMIHSEIVTENFKKYDQGTNNRKTRKTT